MKAEMTAQEKVDAVNKNPVGTNVTYWPTLHKNGRRTKIRHPAYVDAAGQPVIFCEGIAGCVHTDHIQFGTLVATDSPIYDKEFNHRW